MSIKQRDDHLKQYFSADILSQLDEAQKNILDEEYANSELRLLATQSVEDIKGQADRHLTEEYDRRMSHIQESEYPELKEWYQSISNSLHEVICSKCGALIALEVDTKAEATNTHHLQGRYVVAVGDNLFAYRPRLDGLMGYQCANYVKSETFDDWEKFNKDAEEYNAAFAEYSKQYNEDLEAYNALTDKEKEKSTVPEYAFDLEVPVAPEIPPMVPCGNDTRWSQIEIDNIEEAHIMTSLTKEDIVKVKQDMNAQDYTPDSHKTKKGYTAESFEIREVK